MHGTKAAGILTMCAALAAAADKEVSFSGSSALEFTRQVVALGPRPPGSEANRRLQAYLRKQLQQYRCEIIEDPFKANTPLGPIEMRNMIARFKGASGRAIVITGHFDTKSMPGTYFTGANDGGSSTGLLLELARVLATRQHKDDVYLVWFDGEEALVRWSATDGLHGSRHLAQEWASDGTLRRITALINVDMIGDKDLGILQEMNSTPALRKLVWKAAADLGYGRYFLETGTAIEDDHAPFLKLGVSAVDLIDFDYGPGNDTYWHTDKDTMDKLSAHSLEVVGNVLLEVLRRIERQ